MYKNLIGGEWVHGTRTSRNINPSDTGDLVGEFAQADASQARQAIEAASVAQKSWAQSTPQQRFDILDMAGTEILARKLELGDLLAREEGKTLPEAIGEVTRAAHIFKFFAGETLRTSGDLVPSVRLGVNVEVTREPVGVVGLITPWNFPIAIPAWKLAPALAFGNAVVLKPAELVPGSAWALADILQRAGLPPGVLNLVMGRGSEVGQVLLEDERVNAISFTGSVDTGRRVARACVERMAKFQLEMGGKNPMVVLDDADLDVAVGAAINSAFFSTGQRCTASSRFIVTERIHDRFVSAMADRMSGLKVDDARTSGTDIGPVVDERQLSQDQAYINIGKAEGARLVAGGETIATSSHGKPGFYLQPTLFADTTASMRINREEIFGPVASVVKVRSYEEALAMANDTEFGLSAGIATTSLKHATHFKRNSQAGMVMVNLPTAGVDYHVPFGGRKGSSYGPREQGRYASEFYTTVKTAYTQA
ncbi:Aldehyde dehydrogenase, thermostable [Variovorax sp. PBS-H4]|uniref:aldehyde dehydrogenase family protein n=1 Tax=Variovorax sp. PBS-H4 TaxID=434008 RepID=UPI0013163B35|nr:aldehyde dehydrogenase family protein [Variovorax sp. PBS-H4]VTU36072.1 Aldehyde dehydrogenase, thermostable [Variovorax sp. PBS-H4]